MNADGLLNKLVGSAIPQFPLISAQTIRLVGLLKMHYKSLHPEWQWMLTYLQTSFSRRDAVFQQWIFSLILGCQVAEAVLKVWCEVFQDF